MGKLWHCQKKKTITTVCMNISLICMYSPPQPIPFLGPYSVSKTALFGLTKALAAEVCISVKCKCKCKCSYMSLGETLSI